jgi:proline dehydrogenase
LGLKELLLLRVARRWISGVDLDSAIKDAKRANSRGMGAILNYLGEEITDQSVADAHLQEYLNLQRAIHSDGIDGCASVKLTQFGLMGDEQRAAERLERCAANAEELGQPLWIDMEGSRFTSKAIEIYLDALQRHRALGVAIQAYMRRSEGDLNRILDKGGRVRLVKGAYREPPELVFRSRSSISENYAKLMSVLFERGDNFAIATHDSSLVSKAKKLAESSHAKFEFEMLKGIRNELKEELVRSGYRVSEYLPYGELWYPYSRRRLSEHPSNVILLLRSLL